MARKRRLDELRPEDFPGVDLIAFARWRTAAIKYEPLAWAVYIAIAVILGVVFLGFRPLRSISPVIRIPLFALITFSILMGSILLLTQKPRKLAREAGITPRAIKEARTRHQPDQASQTPELKPEKRHHDIEITTNEVIMPRNGSPKSVVAGTRPDISGAPPDATRQAPISVNIKSKRCQACGTANPMEIRFCWSCNEAL